MSNTIITIARGYGSGGRTIGKMLSKEMNIPFYDRELIYLASDESGINVRLFSQNDETVKRGIFDRSSKYEGDLIPPENSKFVSKQNIFNYQAKIIKDLADKGDCIIVGRCADFVLKDSGHKVLKVFVWAPYQDCINTVVEKFSVTATEADKTISQIDKHRMEYYKYYTGQDWENVRNYDLCFDTSKHSYEQVVQAIKQYSEIYKNL
ncbi:MAG: AAA family ATPase [Acutalibacteraceae bacterium]